MILTVEQLNALRELLKNTPYDLLSDEEILERLDEILEYLKLHLKNKSSQNIDKEVLKVRNINDQEENFEKYNLKIPKKNYFLEEEETQHKTR